jgi:hypothetical protein
MTQITLSPSQLQNLDEGQTLVECRDPAGQLVGYLHVTGTNGSATIPQFTAEQLAQYEREPGGRSLGEILTDVRNQQ